MLLPTFWLEHTQVRAHKAQGGHVGAVEETRPDARPVIGQPVVRPEFIGICPNYQIDGVCVYLRSPHSTWHSTRAQP